MGQKKWTFKTERLITSSPAIGEHGIVYIGSTDSNLYAINPNGTKKWTYKTGYFIESAPVIGPYDMIYFCSGDSNFYSLSEDGEIHWSFSVDHWGDETVSPAMSSNETAIVNLGLRKPSAVGLSEGNIKWATKTRPTIGFPSVIGPQGSVYMSSKQKILFVFYSNSEAPSDSPWPMFQHDYRHTGRAK